MGHAASVEADVDAYKKKKVTRNNINHHNESSSGNYLTSIEKKALNGYYHKNYDEYKNEIASALKNNDIASVELLIPAGDAEKSLPLHLACKYAAVDCVELLLSAGYNTQAMDLNGRTPLHYCCKSNSYISSVCCMLLLEANKKLLRIRDLKGNTALHQAIVENNLTISKLLLEYGAPTGLTNNAGMTPRDLAVHANNPTLVSLFNQKASSPQLKSPGAKTPQDTERIMQVWERFFENAFKSFEKEMQLEMEADPALTLGEGLKGYRSQDSAIYEDDIDITTLSVRDSQQNSPTEIVRYNQHEINSIWNWLSWVLTYDEIGKYEVNSCNGYYVFSIDNQQEPFVDLDDHLYGQENFMIWGGYPGNDEYCEKYPYSLQEVVQNGWMVYYDMNINFAQWMHVASGHIENYLPIGRDPYVQMMGLSYSQESYDWVLAPQDCCKEWLMVKCSEVGTVSNLWYFYNKTTGHSSWTEPYGWQDFVDENGGWVLCSNEQLEYYFWWNTCTGEISSY